MKLQTKLQNIVRIEMKQFLPCFAKHNYDTGKIPSEFAQTKFKVYPNKRAFCPDYRKGLPEARLLAQLEVIWIKQGVFKKGEFNSSFRSNNFLVKKPNKTDYTVISN